MANGRDNARTPFQWDNSAFAGFSKTVPWINMNENYTQINLENDLKLPKSIFKYVKKLLSFRNKGDYSDAVSNGEYEPILIDDTSLFIYKRRFREKELIVIANWSDYDCDYSGVKVLKKM